MKLRSGRIVFNDSVEGYIFLNTYCSISKIQNRIIFRNKLKKLIKKWYLWLIKKHNNSNDLITPWYFFSFSIDNSWINP